MRKVLIMGSLKISKDLDIVSIIKKLRKHNEFLKSMEKYNEFK